MSRPRPWTEPELLVLRTFYEGLGPAGLAEVLNRPRVAVQSKASDLGLKTSVRRPWTPELDAALRRLYPTTLASEIAAQLGLTRGAVYQRANSLGLAKDEGFAARVAREATLARSPITPAIAAQLRQRYADTPTPDLAAQTGLPVDRIHAWANRNGLKKSREAVAAMARARSTDDHASARYRFPKGHVPANKGVKGKNYPGMQATQFKKGTMPHTWKPVGTYRINADGVLDRKVSDTGYPPRDWAAVHRLVWIEAHGRIPEGHIVRFLEGKKTNVLEEITVDRLECISKAENARRNAWHTKLPPDLRRLMGTRIALSRAVKKHAERNAQEAS
jgi:hypothetical protein